SVPIGVNAKDSDHVSKSGMVRDSMMRARSPATGSVSDIAVLSCLGLAYLGLVVRIVENVIANEKPHPQAPNFKPLFRWCRSGRGPLGKERTVGLGVCPALRAIDIGRATLCRCRQEVDVIMSMRSSEAIRTVQRGACCGIQPVKAVGPHHPL